MFTYIFTIMNIYKRLLFQNYKYRMYSIYNRTFILKTENVYLKTE